MDREICDLSHQINSVHDIGRVSCIGRFDVMPGSSLELDSTIMLRLNQLRRPLAIDPKVDVHVFYAPYRYTYGQKIIDMVENPFDFSQTFETTDTGITPFYFLQSQERFIPKHLWSDFANIYNCYYRDPSQDEFDLDDPTGFVNFGGGSTWVEGTRNVKYGPRICHLKGWGTAQSHLADLDDPDYNIDVSGGSVDLFDLQKLRTDVKGDLFRDFYSSRYVEIIESIGGKNPHDYSDNRPELLWSESQFMSGYDINGTAGSDLGNSVGKGVSIVNLNMPRRMFTEHGTVYVLLVVRFPPIFENAKRYLDNLNRGAHFMLPQNGSSYPPVQLTMEDLFVDGSPATSAGYVPFYEWYRHQPSWVHPQFFDVSTGWQHQGTPSTTEDLYVVGDYDDMFQSLQMRHVTSSIFHKATAYHPIPSQEKSIFGGM